MMWVRPSEEGEGGLWLGGTERWPAGVLRLGQPKEAGEQPIQSPCTCSRAGEEERGMRNSRATVFRVLLQLMHEVKNGRPPVSIDDELVVALAEDCLPDGAVLDALPGVGRPGLAEDGRKLIDAVDFVLARAETGE